MLPAECLLSVSAVLQSKCLPKSTAGSWLIRTSSLLHLRAQTQVCHRLVSPCRLEAQVRQVRRRNQAVPSSGEASRWQQQGGYRPTATAYRATAEHERSDGNDQENASAFHSDSQQQEQNHVQIPTKPLTIMVAKMIKAMSCTTLRLSHISPVSLRSKLPDSWASRCLRCEAHFPSKTKLHNHLFQSHHQR